MDTTRYIYDATVGFVDTIIAPNGHRTAMVYTQSGTKQGLLSSFTELAVPVIDTTTWLRQTPDPNLVTQFTYNVTGNDSITTRPDGKTSKRYYDGAQNVTSAIDAMGHTTTYTYDVLTFPPI